MLKRARTRKPKGTRKVNYKLIDSSTEQGRWLYIQMQQRVKTSHPTLVEASIGLAWCSAWRPDVDGRTVVGKMRRSSDLDKELGRDFDFVMLLNRNVWPMLTEEQHAAILDHELCHAAPKCDDRTGEQLRDERGRLLWRIRKHDIEEFIDIVERHGTYTREIELLATALHKKACEEPFVACGQDGCVNGFVVTVDEQRVPTARLCQCRAEYLERRRQLAENAA